jgi:hypothetical protein
MSTKTDIGDINKDSLSDIVTEIDIVSVKLT